MCVWGEGGECVCGGRVGCVWGVSVIPFVLGVLHGFGSTTHCIKLSFKKF